MNLVEFLEARIAEDEAAAREQDGAEYYTDGAWPDGMAARVLAECAAKRAIIAEHRMVERADGIKRSTGCALCNFERDYGWDEIGPCKTLRAIASVYKDHPDYQQDWSSAT